MPKDWTKDPSCKYAYLFKEGGGATVDDSSGNGNIGTFKSATEPAWSGDVPYHKLGGKSSFASVLFDNGNDFINAGTSDVITENGAFTFICWAKQLGAGVNGRLFQRGSVIFYADQGGDGKALTYEVDGTGGTLIRATSNATVSFNIWQRLGLTSTGSNTATNAKIYVNGVETSYQTTTNGALPTDNAGQGLFIGDNSNGDRCYNGNLTDIIIFNRVLTAAEMLDDFNYGINGLRGVMTTGGWWGES